MQLPAVALGVLIGLVSGLAFMLLLRTALSGKLEFKASSASQPIHAIRVRTWRATCFG